MTKIMIVAGEPSGDAHAARLISQLPKTFNFYGMGGSAMQNAGVELIENIQKTSVMGIFELISKLPYLYHILFKLKKTLELNPPDLLILVDYQAFNLKLAKIAKKFNIKTLFYIGPQVWAWRTYRVKKIKKIVDFMAVIFPFEVDFYKQYQMSATYVGHPLVTGIVIKLNRAEFLAKYNISDNKTIIAFLPGSRSNEVKHHLPLFVQTIKHLQDNSTIQFLISRYDKNNPNIEPYFSSLDSNIIIIDEDYYSMINAADFAVVASGTATLETALLKTPMIMVVSVSKLSYAIYKRIIKTPFIAIVNIIAGREIVKELVQENATVKNIVSELEILQNPLAIQTMQQGFAEINKKLAVQPQESLKDLVLKILNIND